MLDLCFGTLDVAVADSMLNSVLNVGTVRRSVHSLGGSTRVPTIGWMSRSIRPPRRTLRHELTSVCPTGTPNVSNRRWIDRTGNRMLGFQIAEFTVLGKG